MPSRTAPRPLARRTTGAAWFTVALGSLVPGGLALVPLFLVAGIVAWWGRPRSIHLWLAACLCQGVLLVQRWFGGVWLDWLIGVVLGGFPALSIALALWLWADREEGALKTLPRSA
ncbi:MAG: hypothetical protein WD226_05040 [Planctomycetota bacterium]